MKRFYKDVTVGEVDGGWQVLLDGRGLKSVGKRPQAVPTQALAEVLAGEWAAQGEEIDPASFLFRDLADYAIDVVANERDDVARSLVAYAETDTLCYRGDEDEPLHQRQLDVWEPLLTSAEQRWDVHFERISGIIHKPQPPETLARMETILSAENEFSLAALKTLTSLSASLVIALAAIASDADPEELWLAANLEEDWQAELWGKDAEAEDRREKRYAAFKAAMRFAALARQQAREAGSS